MNGIVLSRGIDDQLSEVIMRRVAKTYDFDKLSDANMTNGADFKAFFYSIPPERREEFARAAGTTVGNIQAHLIHARRVPRRENLRRLCNACERFGAPFTAGQLIEFFYHGEKAGASA